MFLYQGIQLGGVVWRFLSTFLGFQKAWHLCNPWYLVCLFWWWDGPFFGGQNSAQTYSFLFVCFLVEDWKPFVLAKNCCICLGSMLCFFLLVLLRFVLASHGSDHVFSFWFGFLVPPLLFLVVLFLLLSNVIPPLRWTKSLDFLHPSTESYSLLCYWFKPYKL